ncbi:Protein timeless [Gryllus bimaculatus]|nr:Protein timeless [Gryllus bimaculatus]
MSSLLFAEIAATCNALGYSDGARYFTDPQCEEAVKDLIRYLRRDDENHEIRRHLGEAKILQTDLLPILKEHCEETELFDHVLRLLVNLTYPALVLYNAELPEDKTSRFYYLQIISHLQSYKEAFVDEVVWAVLCRKLGNLLNIEWQDRSEDEGKVIERILTLVRNVLQVPADREAEKRPDNDATIHDQVLWALYQSGMVGLLHYVISSKHEDRFHMHVLEIISQMLRDQNPAYLATAEAQRSIVEKTRDEAELLAVRQREAQERHQKNEKYTGLKESCRERPRIRNYWGSRFAGTYVVKDVKSISNNDMIYHKPLATLTALDLNHDKKKLKTPKNKRPPVDTIVERRSTLSVRLFLKEFCIEFLNGAYNTLMYSVKEMIHHGKNQVNDESYYLWAMKFFMEFNRHYKAEMKLISETMSLSTFHFIQTQIENYHERMLVEKKKIFAWSRRMHLALRAYQELLMTLTTMDTSTDPDVKESARIIKSNIFYVVEYRELILFLMVNFHQSKFSRAFLKDLIETVHIFLKLLEHFCTRGRGIVVQEKQKGRHNKAKKKNSQKNQPASTPLSPEELWEGLTLEVSTVIENQTNMPENVVPFDSASEVPIDEQKVDAVKRIQAALRDRQFELAVGLLRASREVWPENDSFGAPNPAPEEEILALKDIFLADLGQPMQMPENPNANEEENEEEEEGEEEEDEREHDREMSTNVSERTFQFCNPRVVQACGLLLREFEHNSVRTNHCALKLMHRIAWDCKLPAMIFQASIFRTFQRILDSELKKFAIFVVRKFVEVAKENPKVYMELLFWKNSKDAFEVECGYGILILANKSGERRKKMNLGACMKNMIDWILRNLISDSRSRRGVIKKLKELGYVVATKPTSRKSVTTKPPVQWSTEEEEQLTSLYSQFKDAYDPMSCILDRLTVRRPKSRVVEKLLAMGLVQDKKELRKKRGKKNQNAGGAGHSEESGQESDVDDVDSRGSDSEEDSITTAPNAIRHQNLGQKKSKTRQQKQSKSMFSQNEAARLVGQVRTAGMSEALEWLVESLEDIAEDAEDCAEESTPLLPLTEACIVAMDSPLFQQLLQSLGINAPADEQETYWRVPGHLTAAQLRDRKNILLDSTTEEFFNSEDFDQQVADKCRRILSQNERDLEIEMESQNSDNNTLETSSLSSVLSLIQTPKSTPNLHSVSVNDLVNENAPSVSEINESMVASTSRSVKATKNEKLKFLVDSSESEEESLNQNVHNNKENGTIAESKNINVKAAKKGKLKALVESSNSEDDSSESEEESLNQNVHNSKENMTIAESKNRNVKAAEKGRLKALVDSSDSEDESCNQNAHNNKEDTTTNTKSAKKGKLRILVDSSESEDESLQQTALADNETTEMKSKRLLDSDSESECPKAKKHCKVLSDDED